MDDFSLDDSLTDGSRIDGSTIAPEEQLNKIYITVLRNSVRNLKKQERKKWYKLLRETVGTIIILFSPLSAYLLAGLLHVRREDIIQTLDDLHSILDMPENQSRPICLHRPSFRDFLVDKKRCDDPNLWVDEKQTHRDLVNRCIQLVSTLERDICSLERDAYRVRAPGVLIDDIDSSRVEQYLFLEVQYACLY